MVGPEEDIKRGLKPKKKKKKQKKKRAKEQKKKKEKKKNNVNKTNLAPQAKDRFWPLKTCVPSKRS